MRHMRFGETGDLHDIESLDWPTVKAGLREDLYGANEPLPVQVDDLGSLVATRPSDPITTRLAWAELDDERFERLIFSLISDTPGYENPEWLMQTRARSRSRPFRHARRPGRAVGHFALPRRDPVQALAEPKCEPAGGGCGARLDSDMESPRVDVLIVATSGRFAADAVTWVETHNATGTTPRIEMWPESHLERLLASRPALIAEFGLRG